MAAGNQRIFIIGAGGSGKSTLARMLGDSLNRPVHHMDKLFWQPGWKSSESSKKVFDDAISRITRQKSWILEGAYMRSLDTIFKRADLVIFLDLPPWLCLWRVFRRQLTYRGRVRPDAPDGCIERFEPEFIRWIYNFQRQQKPVILKKLNEHPGIKKVFLKTSTDIRQFL